MRGRTSAAVHSYFVRGTIHFLDNKTYAVLQKYFSKRRFLTVLAKNLIETGDLEELAKEYDVPVDAAFHSAHSQGDAELAAALASMA